MNIKQTRICPRLFAPQSQEAVAVSSIELMVAMVLVVIATFGLKSTPDFKMEERVGFRENI